MKQGTIIIYWGPVGALVYFFLTTNDRGELVFCRLGTEPETATAGDFWRMSPDWMDQKRRAGILEELPDGLGPDDRARIDAYDKEHEIL